MFLKNQFHILERLVAGTVDVKSGATYYAFCGMQRQGSWQDGVLKAFLSEVT